MTKKDLIKNLIRPTDIGLILAVTLISTGLSLLPAYFVKLLTGDVILKNSETLLVGVFVMMLSAEIFSQLMKSLKKIFSGRFGLRSEKYMEEKTMEKMLSLPISFFRQFPAGELYQRQKAVPELYSVITGAIVPLCIGVFSGVAFSVQISGFTPKLLIPAIVIIIATVFVSFLTSLKKVDIGKREVLLSAKENAISLDIIRGASKIKHSGSEDTAFKKWEEEYDRAAKLKYDPPFFIKVSPVLFTVLKIFGGILIYYIAAKYDTEVSDYLAFNTAYGGLLSAFSTLSDTALSFASVPPVLNLAKPILDAVPEDMTGKEEVKELSGRIEVKNLTFGYEEGKDVIKNLSFSIEPGEFVSIEGKTGCGKTTLIRLLLGLEKPREGQVLYDGKDIETLNKKELRKNIGAAIQDGRLFAEDIFTNITIGDESLTEEDVWAAAEMSEIKDEIKDFPLLLENQINETGTSISGGQKQRFLIARAVCKKPKIIIFDEAMSALDAGMQEAIITNVRKTGATLIVVSHRPETVAGADKKIKLP